jgi:hypothetical protein
MQFSAFVFASSVLLLSLSANPFIVSAIAFLPMASILMDQLFLLDSCQHLFKDYKILPVAADDNFVDLPGQLYCKEWVVF